MKNYFVLAAVFMLPLMSCKKDNPTEPENPENTAPTVPTFIEAPENGAEGTETDLEITWNASTDADEDPVKYNLYLGTNADDIVGVASALTVTNYSITGLSLGTTYFLKVEAYDGVNTAVSSEVREFTTSSSGSFTDSLSLIHI